MHNMSIISLKLKYKHSIVFFEKLVVYEQDEF